jgi:hypothetical protein
MRFFRNILLAIVAVFALVIAHYTLPQHDVVRVVNTYQERQDLGDWTRIFWSNPDDQSGTLVNRDVQFIQTVRKKSFLFGFVARDAEGVMVYRNEDTGWRWPPYFKFDTASLQTEADDLRSTPEAPKWAVMTHYGWRNELLSAFPNAVAIKPVDGPRPTIIPWFNIVFFAVLIALLLFIRAMWRQFRERTIDPALDDTRDAWEKVDEFADEKRGRVSRWWRSWTGR